MKTAKEAKAISINANIEIETQISNLIDENCEIGRNQCLWTGTMNKETKETLEMYGYQVVRLTKHGRRIIRNSTWNK